MLHVRRFGSGPPLVALHGFTLTGEQFAGSSAHLHRTVYAPDLPGHGLSADIPTDVGSAVAGVAELCDSIEPHAPLLGYSQGGRIALVTSLERPDTVPFLILVSASAGIADAKVRQERSRSDQEIAASIRTGSIGEFLDAWTTRGLTDTSHLPDDVRAADRAVRDQNTSDGLASALEGFGQGSQSPVWDRLPELTMPVLLLHGANDEKYQKVANKMAASIPDATVVSVPGAGHNPLLDAPRPSYNRISAFLDRFG